MSTEAAELQRLRMLPWSRVVTAKSGGGFQARVRELPQCRSEGATPVDALTRLEEELEQQLQRGLRGEGPLPSPSFWDPTSTEALPVRLPKIVIRAAETHAERQGLNLSEYVERATIAATDVADAQARDDTIDAVTASSSRASHGANAASSGLLDRVVFPEARSSTDHWQRVVLDQSIAAHLATLDPSTRTAAEISGDTHAGLAWKAYESLDYPQFDLAGTIDGQGPYDVVICEQVLEHIADLRRAVANLRELTRPGGHVIVSTPFLVRVHELPEYGMHDYWRFTPRGLATLLEDVGLVVDEVHDWGNRWCVYGNLQHWSSRRRWHTLRRESNVPVQVWAFARNPG